MQRSVSFPKFEIERVFGALNILAQSLSLRFLDPLNCNFTVSSHGFSHRIIAHFQASVLRFRRHPRPNLRLPPPPRRSQATKEIEPRPNPNSLPRQALPLLPQLLSLHPPHTPPRDFQVQRRRFAPRTVPSLQALPRLLGHNLFSVGFQAILRRIPETSHDVLPRVLLPVRRSRSRGFGASREASTGEEEGQASP